MTGRRVVGLVEQLDVRNMVLMPIMQFHHGKKSALFECTREIGIEVSIVVMMKHRVWLNISLRRSSHRTFLRIRG